jgi:hypothetical protein
MVRLRGKPCPRDPRLSGASGDEATRATEVPSGPVAVSPGYRHRRAILAAGECGVKDQVSRTQPVAPPGEGRLLDPFPDR